MLHYPGGAKEITEYLLKIVRVRQKKKVQGPKQWKKSFFDHVYNAVEMWGCDHFIFYLSNIMISGKLSL